MMATRKVRTLLYECDGCGRQVIGNPERDEPIPGYHGGSVYIVHSGGGAGCKSWYACSSDCVDKAIHNACFPERD
jgi:hypothetical protein